MTVSTCKQGEDGGREMTVSTCEQGEDGKEGCREMTVSTCEQGEDGKGGCREMTVTYTSKAKNKPLTLAIVCLLTWLMMFNLFLQDNPPSKTIPESVSVVSIRQKMSVSYNQQLIPLLYRRSNTCLTFCVKKQQSWLAS